MEKVYGVWNSIDGSWFHRTDGELQYSAHRQVMAATLQNFFNKNGLSVQEIGMDGKPVEETPDGSQ
jgi:hypothetical protein